MLGGELWLFHRGNEGDAGNVVARDRALGPRGLAHGRSRHRRRGAQGASRLRPRRDGRRPALLLGRDGAPRRSRLLHRLGRGRRGRRHPRLGGRTISGSGEVRRLRTIDRKWKVEGVHASIDTGVIDFVFVCDQDDEAVASPLLTATMPLPLESRCESSSTTRSHRSCGPGRDLAPKRKPPRLQRL